LRDGCALRENTLEVRVMPMRRKVYPGLGITVAIDQSAQRREWQIKAIDGMREEHRVSFRGLDGPQIMEFDDQAVGVEKRRTSELARIVTRDWGPRKLDCPARRDFVVPRDVAGLDPAVA